MLRWRKVYWRSSGAWAQRGWLTGNNTTCSPQNSGFNHHPNGLRPFPIPFHHAAVRLAVASAIVRWRQNTPLYLRPLASPSCPPASPLVHVRDSKDTRCLSCTFRPVFRPSKTTPEPRNNFPHLLRATLITLHPHTFRLAFPVRVYNEIASCVPVNYAVHRDVCHTKEKEH
ncbi:hypothetical protein BGZ60DRAFT_18878 [Tricladium varicosporioides]|nr:hypothetical protein BGZ60DRAFT_18878 [Hymenoscyphus varicosporioides]